jgi:transposase-like protein
MRAPTILLAAEERKHLQRICRGSSSPEAKAFRAQLVLRCAKPDDPTNWQVAVEFECDPDTVCKWRRRFAERRLAGLDDAPRSGRPRSFSP